MKAYTSEKQQYPKWYLAYARNMANNYPDLTTGERLAELYKKLSWVATAIDIVSIVAAMAGKSVKKITGEEEEDVPNHDFERLLLDPNPIASGRSFIRSVVADYKLHGKAFIWINLVNNKPVELWRIPPTMMNPQSSGSLGIEYFVYDYGAGKMSIPAAEVVYWKDYDPNNLIDPSSNLTSVSLTSNNDLMMQSWNNNVYKGNGRLPGVMTFADMIPDPLWDQIGDDINEAASKQNILRLRGTGSGAVNWIQTSTAPKDMEFYTGRDNNRAEIWSRIAPGLTSTLSENATEANSRTGKATLIDLCVYPLIQMLYETMTQQIIWPYYGTEFIIEPDDIRVTDRVLDLAEISEYSKTATVNEVRTKRWKLDELKDERGTMLVAEAQTYKTEKPETSAPVIAPDKKQPDKALPAETSNAQVEVDAQQEQAAQKMRDPHSIILELEKWERKAIKNIGKQFEFDCYSTPVDLVKSIKTDLIGCANPAAVKSVFVKARDEIGEYQTPEIDTTSAILALAAAINKAAEK